MVKVYVCIASRAKVVASHPITDKNIVPRNFICYNTLLQYEQLLFAEANDSVYIAMPLYHVAIICFVIFAFFFRISVFRLSRQNTPTSLLGAIGGSFKTFILFV